MSGRKYPPTGPYFATTYTALAVARDSGWTISDKGKLAETPDGRTFRLTVRPSLGCMCVYWQQTGGGIW